MSTRPMPRTCLQGLGALLLAIAMTGCATKPLDLSHDWPMVPATRVATAHPKNELPLSLPNSSDRLVTDPVPLANTALDQLPNVFDRIRLGYQLPEVEDPAIDRLVRFYVSKPESLDRTFERAERYLYYVTRELEARNMPLELAFLPVIESAYNPYAYSRARAAGLWQFIPPTAKRYDVRVNWWQDGRRDVVESTRAALDYLSELHTLFDGDWLLAIAAYNCGEQAVLRAMERARSRHRPTDFWHLDLPKETRGYVPSLLAMARIVADPEHYGLEFTPIANQPYFARVDIGTQIDLRLAAALLHLNDDELHALNPAFNRWATDPEGPYPLLVPHAQAHDFARTVSDLPLEARVPIEHYTLASDESLDSIAKARKLPLSLLQQMNDPLNGFKAGDDIVLPASKIDALRAGLIIEGESPVPSRQGHHKLYVVRRGDTLASIARKYRVGTKTLAQMNGLSTQSHLKAGHTLTVDTATAHPTQSPPTAQPHTNPPHQLAATPSAPIQTPPVTASASPRSISYLVRHGDTLQAIASRFAVTIAQVKEWNRLKSTTIRPGQRLVLVPSKNQDYGG